MQDYVVSVRDGRYVIPIKSEYRKNMDGNILDSSGSGQTVYIEPAEVKRLQEELNLCRIDEENEVYRILSVLTAFVSMYEKELLINIEAMSYYDFLLAKGRYSRDIEGTDVCLNTNCYINIKNGKHPLLGKSAIPNDVIIGEAYRAIVITGPNTGGKTVVLKTVGLMTIMVQCGLHVSVDSGSEFAIFADVLADIGDGQSIEQNLSTFSSHITNIIDIVANAGSYSLVVLDEIGAGTDPAEGMGLAASILESLYKKGATILATTHYSEIKSFASHNEGFINGCMEFDIKTLRPTYRLKIGEAGKSNAFLIALRLGMEKTIIERAHEYTYKEKCEYNDYTIEEVKFDNSIFENKNSLKQIINKEESALQKPRFNLGDCVYISTMERTGVVCEPQNSKGEFGVMVMKKKLWINHKRLSLYIDSNEMYPDDYDFDVVFETKDNRKNKKIFNKRHEEGIEVKIRDGNMQD